MTFDTKKLNVKGLTKRWIVNVLSVVFAVLLIFGMGASLVLRQYYVVSVEEYLYAQLETVSSSFTQYASGSVEEFEAGAKGYAETFADHQSMEVQLLSDSGKVLVSTAGYVADTDFESTDYQNAWDAPEHTALWRGETDGGEKIMSGVTLILSKEDPNICIGAIRIIVSMAGVNRQYGMIVTTLVVITAVFFLLIVASGTFFVRSIITPIQGIGKTAQQIARGEFEARIEAKNHQDDEIGTLCDTINYMAGELASTEQMKNEFISSVSHELRTPLTAIKGWGETIVTATDDPALVKKGLEVIIGEAERLSVIVEDLLDFSRMQNGKLTYQMKPCDVVAEMSEAIMTLADNAIKKKVEIDFSEPENIPVVVGDAVRLQQVFVNLLDNALKYTPEEGSIVVDMKSHGDTVEILVSDTGRGIDPEDLDHIKQKFYKGKDAVRGSGIGLAIVDEIVSAHGGRVTFASTLHVGTTVTVLLPVDGTSHFLKEDTV